MLVRVRGGKDGIAEYLQDGLKSNRDMHRDQMDKVISIDGDLFLTDSIIKSMVKTDNPENYFHITLSFAERDISEATMRVVYDQFKNELMSAYVSQEFNLYAEIHFPKIKSYQDKSSGAVVERFPHIHVVMPKKNLLNAKNLNPFGFYKSHEHYIQAIQEKINYQYNLISPRDNQRLLNVDNGHLLARYKGDHFNGANATLKRELFDVIQTKNIVSMSAFKQELNHYGEVSVGKAGTPDAYLKIKPHGATRNVRLTDPCFGADFIEHRVLKREKPSERQVNRLVEEWMNSKSHEVKYIHSAAPKLREQYKALSTQLKRVFLNEQRERYYQQYDLSSGIRFVEQKRASQRNLSASGWACHRKLGVERGIPRGFADIPNGLPSLSQRNVARTGRARRDSDRELLPDHAPHHLAIEQSHRSSQLRWSCHEPRRRVARFGEHRPPSPNMTLYVWRRLKAKEQYNKSYVVQLFDTFQVCQQEQNELGRFRTIRHNLKAESLLSHLVISHGLVSEQYRHFSAKDGSTRIKVGNRAYNVSDFCTQHMGFSWDETKVILKKAYSLQRRQLVQQQQALQEQQAVNSIVFVSNRSAHRRPGVSPIEASIRLLRHLQRKEQIGEVLMSLDELERYRSPEPKDNTILAAHREFSAVTSAKQITKAREIAAQLTLTMNDLVASKNEAKQYVDFSDKNTGKKLFRDDGEKIVMYHRQADINHTAVALTLAAEKFGVVKIIGTKEFKQQVIDVAVNKDLAIVFADKKMEAEFIRRKQALRLPPNTELANALCANKEKAQKESRQRVGACQQPSCLTEKRRKAVKMVSK